MQEGNTIFFHNLFVTKEAQRYSLTQRWLDYAHNKQIPIYFIEQEKDLPENTNPKTTLLLTVKKGGFVKPCPCTPGAVCCGYYNINLIEGCPFTCHYCALDFYLKTPAIRIFVNLEDFEQELEAFLSTHRLVRIGTGELTDSLVWEEVFSYAQYLVQLFQKYPQAILELKTKSVAIKNLLNIPREARTQVLISFSINTEAMIAREEKNAPSFEERLLAAIQLKKQGFKIGFHFDPIYDYPDYQKDYQEVIKKIFTFFQSSDIGWISLGVIRFSPALKEKLYERKSAILNMELLPAPYDGKLRLFYKKRKKILLFLLENIRQYTDKIYFCMEPYFLWEDLHYQEKAIDLNKKIFTDFFA